MAEKERCLSCILHGMEGYNFYLFIQHGGRGEDSHTLVAARYEEEAKAIYAETQLDYEEYKKEIEENQIEDPTIELMTPQEYAATAYDEMHKLDVTTKED